MELSSCGELNQRVQGARALLESCHLCPRRCGIERLKGETGKCHTGRYALVSSYSPHFGEEEPLVGTRGSGTIFFAFCNMHCLFCQNYSISQYGEGEEVSAEELAAIMLRIQNMGCHNINLVSPTHVIPQFLEALSIAALRGLNIPIVYNSGGYDSLETLRLLDDIIDIYMPDMKYADASIAEEISGIKDYPGVNQAAVKEMHSQVGDLQMDENGVATRGLLVRHLVLPNSLAGTEEIIHFLSHEVSQHTYTNIMAQYRPCYKAQAHPGLALPLKKDEYSHALSLALKAGLDRLDKYPPALNRLIR